jgi:hypothetical protein
MYAAGVSRRGTAGVKRLAAIFVLLNALAAAPSAGAQTFTVDKLSSDGLTHFLHKRGLHAVGAQISDGDDGSRRMVLYGFVANPAEKADALELSHKYLGDPDIELIDSITVKPSLSDAEDAPAPPPLASPPPDEGAAAEPVPPPDFRGPSGDSAPPAAASTAGSESQWDRVMEHIGERGAPPPPDP